MFKKTLALILTIIISIASVFAVSANNTTPPSISYQPYYNDIYYSGSAYVDYGQEITLELKDLTIGGVPADEDLFSFCWYKDGGSNDNIIADANGARLTFVAQRNTTYSCSISADGAMGAFVDFHIYVDTIQNTIECSNPFETDGSINDTFFYINDCVLGSDITITLNSTSYTDGELNYAWYKFNEYHIPEGDVLSTSNTLTLNKSEKGFLLYCCTVSDGSYNESVLFKIMPDNTLNETVKINGIKPERFERGYMAVASPGDEIDLTVEVDTKNGSFTRRWEKVVYTVMGPQITDLGTAETITVTKQDILDDEYDFEQFECYLDDGNEVFQVGLVLFSLHPYQVTTETQIDENTPEVTLDDNTDTLANNLLQENLFELSNAKNAVITLTAQEITELETTEQNALNSVLPENAEIGTCLDINLYKQIEDSEKSQITEASGEVTLSVDVPEKMLDDGNSKFTVTRIHNGKAENLECEYDSENQKISFKTDRFSTYVLSSKQSVQPDAPIVETVIGQTVTLAHTDGFEYSMDKSTWQKSNIFTDVPLDLEISFYQRSSLGVSIAIKVIIVSAPEVFVGFDTARITDTNGYEYSCDGKNWSDSNIFNLTNNSSYTFFHRPKNKDGVAVFAENGTTAIINGRNTITNPIVSDLVWIKKRLLFADSQTNLGADFNADNCVNILDLISMKKKIAKS